MRENLLSKLVNNAKIEGMVMDKIDELRKRHDLMNAILDYSSENPIFGKMLDFYRNIFSQNPGLVIFMSRKSWCVFQLFLPFLEAEGTVKAEDKKKLTHDRMIHPWFAEQDHDKLSRIKIIVTDDTFQTGRALDDCVRRLVLAYNIDKNNISVSVFAMTDDNHGFNRQRVDLEKSLYNVRKSQSRGMESFDVKWLGDENTFCSKDKVSLFSYLFVEALHACSVPYVGYIPAFRLPLEDVRVFLGTDRGKEIALDNAPDVLVPGYLEQEDLKDHLNDSNAVGYYNITSQLMRQRDVEAFYFTLPEEDSGNKNYLPFSVPKYAFSIAALRFYLNRKTGFALIVPYLSLKDCYSEADIVKVFPEKIKHLVKNLDSTQDWSDREEHIAAYRLLRYAAGYLWGKSVFKEWFGRDVMEEDIVSRGGICSDAFFSWLDGPSAEQDLADIWPFFDPVKGNVIKETQSPEFFDKNLTDVISKNLKVNPVDYFGTVSKLFRGILEWEYKLLIENAAAIKKGDALPQPFIGFSIQYFFSLLLTYFPKLKNRKNVLTTVTLMLCDLGIAVTQLQQHKNVIGTVLLNGEQSCHALAPIVPEYTHFLSELPFQLRKFNNKRRLKKIEMAKKEIHQYFKDEKKNSVIRRLSLEELMAPLDDMIAIAADDKEPDFIPYSVLPRSSFFDNSELFFLFLRRKLTARLFFAG